VGHEGIAEVISVGDGVQTFVPGDRVFVPWKISCGDCASCARGHTAHCESVPFEAAYSWGPTARQYGGFLADLVLVPFADHMLVPVPAGIDDVSAVGITDNVTDAWRAVAPGLKGRPGATVLVAGGGGPGSTGLFAAGLASALGAGLVVYVDGDPDRGKLAESWGAVSVTSLQEVGAPPRFELTVDSSGRPEVLAELIRRTASNGTCTSTTASIYRGDTALPLLEMYRHSITLTTGWAHTRALMEQPLRLIVDGVFDPKAAFTQVADFSAAADALAAPFTKLAFLVD
jgi:alcohol dehydrogenase